MQLPCVISHDSIVFLLFPMVSAVIVRNSADARQSFSFNKLKDGQNLSSKNELVWVKIKKFSRHVVHKVPVNLHTVQLMLLYRDT